MPGSRICQNEPTRMSDPSQPPRLLAIDDSELIHRLLQVRLEGEHLELHFAKSGIEIPLERVNNVNFSQGIFERMLGAGDLLIESGGEDGHQRFTDIKHPDRITNLIHAAMEENGRENVGTVVSGGTDVASQLEKLEGLLQRGSITQAEYDSQKRKLLG